MSNAPRPRAAIYARISDIKKAADKDKVPAQIALCDALAEKVGYDVVATFREADATSASTGAPRPQFEALLKLIDAGQVDVVMATESERLIRNEVDGLRLRMACADAGAIWHMVRGGIQEVASASGDLKAGMDALIGRYESRTKSDRQRAKYADLRAKGMPHPGPRVFGWKKGRIEIEFKEADLIRQGYTMILGGASMWSVVKHFNASGVKTARGYDRWSYAAVMQVLKRPRNAALVEHGKDNVVSDNGQWEAIVTKEEWEAVRALLGRPERSYTRVRETRNLLTGIARCGVCGEVMRSTHGNGEPYLRCSSRLMGAGEGRHVTISMAAADAVVVPEIVSALFLGADKFDSPADLELSGLYARQEETRKKISRLVEAVVSGALSNEDVAMQRSALQLDLDDIDAQIAHAVSENARAAVLVEARSNLFSQASVDLVDAAKVKTQIEANFLALPIEQQRSLIKGMAKVTVNPGRGSKRVDVSLKATGSPVEALTA